MLKKCLKLNQYVFKNAINIKKCYVQRNFAQEAASTNYVNPFSADKPTSTPTVENLSKEEEERRLKVLQLELDIANQEGRRVPSLGFMQTKHWEEVLRLSTKSARYKYYQYLWQVEKKVESKERKKADNAQLVAQRKEEMRKEREECKHIIYGLSHTSFFLRVYDSTINHWQNKRLINAMQFAPKVVLDCGYDEHMTKREAHYAAKQLMLCFAENRAHDDPFDLHYCNVNLQSNSMESLKRYIPTMLDPEFPMNIHQSSFTDVFPKENLVYLTPHCRTELTKYNPDDIYIIGAMVDTTNNEPLSLARAKRLGLRMARLPLDQYLQWGAGSGKSLTLNQMINILLDLKKTGDWMTALRHVPRRKVLDDEEIIAERKNRAMKKRVDKLNLRLDSILDFEKHRIGTNKNRVTVNMQPRSDAKHSTVRPRKAIEFNLNNWATGKSK